MNQRNSCHTRYASFANCVSFGMRWRRAVLRCSVFSAMFLSCGLLAWGHSAKAPPEAWLGDAKNKKATTPSAIVLRLNLPIVGNEDERFKRRVLKAVEQLPRSEPRSILVVEFHADDPSTAANSQFERSLAVARFLAGQSLRGVRTVAFLPQGVTGHAVLPALACEEIVIQQDALLGDAGVAEEFIDPTVRRGYAEIAERRRIAPEVVVLGMLDKALEVFVVETLNGRKFVLAESLPALRQSEAFISETRLAGPREFVHLTGRELRLEYGFATHLAGDRRALAAALQTPLELMRQPAPLDEQWRPVLVRLQGEVTSEKVSQLIRSIDENVRRQHANFVCLQLDSAGGSVEQSLRLANYLAAFDSQKVRTVAYVPVEARGDAALIALACDQLAMGAGAVLGGPGGQPLSADELTSLRVATRALAAQKARDWSLLYALLQPTAVIHRFTNSQTREIRYFTDQEYQDLKHSDRWSQAAQLDVSDGVSGARAKELALAKFLPADLAELAALYGVGDEFKEVTPNWAFVLVAALADPRWAGILLFVACFAFMTEAMAPGASVSGFVAVVCFTLFFWSQFLNGTAGWLEVLLFLLGLSCLALEVFVLPGFGVFGLGGGALVIASIVLASQTFVLPHTVEEFHQLPRSLLSIVWCVAGVVAGVVFVQRVLPHTPYFNRILLTPLAEEELEEREEREALVHREHLLGKPGVTTTLLCPSGKARFGDEVVDVVSEGQLVRVNEPVYVAEVRGSQVVVHRVRNPTGQPAS